jgi:hypothetical protein
MNQEAERLRCGVRNLIGMLAPDEAMIEALSPDEARARLIDLTRDLLLLVNNPVTEEVADYPEMTLRDFTTKVLKANEHLTAQVTLLQTDNWEKLKQIRSLRGSLADVARKFAQHLGVG